MALVDAEGELSDVQLPAEGTLAHATLLAAQYLVQSCEFVPEIEVASYLRRAADEYGRLLRRVDDGIATCLSFARRDCRLCSTSSPDNATDGAFLDPFVFGDEWDRVDDGSGYN